MWPGAKVLLMEHNYRSGTEIVDAANRFVARNRYRRPKVMRATCGDQGPLEIVKIARREDQFSWLFERVRRGEKLAVLFRNNESALPLIDLCERHSLAYRFPRSDLTFFTDKIVLDVADLLQLARRPTDSGLFMKLYYKFGLPIARRQAVYACGASDRSGRPILEELRRCPDLSRRGAGRAGGCGGRHAPAAGAHRRRGRHRPADEAGYGAYLEQKRMDSGKLSILGLLAEQEPTPDRLLARLAELREVLAYRQDPAQAMLTLSTIHSARGWSMTAWCCWMFLTASCLPSWKSAAAPRRIPCATRRTGGSTMWP